MTESDPFALYQQWLNDFKAGDPRKDVPMCLSTVDADHKPSSRMVLLKQYDSKTGAFTFYTNYTSRKAKSIEANPNIALNFFWEERQVRIEGPAVKISPEESDAYFATRPRESQIGAWASLQSQPMQPESALEDRLKQLREQYPAEGQPIPRPPHWGGFRIQPTYMEFWQAHPFRLHRRRVFTLQQARWVCQVLFP